MSKTEVKNGSSVWQAACDLARGYDHIDGIWLTAGEVAHKANVSRNTARKYLDIAVEHRLCNRVRPHGKGPIYYRPFETE